MPSSSKKQHNFMEAIAHNKAFAKKAGVPQSVGQEFAKADKGKTFKEGGMMKHSDMKEDIKMDKSQDKAMIKKAFRQHDIQEHKGGKGTKLALKKGGSTDMCYGGKVKKMAAGGQVDPRAAMMAKKRPMPPGGMPPGRMPPPQGNPNVAAPQLQGRPTMARPMAPAAAPAPTMPMKKGGRIASKGEHSVQKKSKRGAMVVKMANGGFVKSADGIAKRGKTRGKMC
jgi:hypothetical protein